jgi:hypothetical protein
LLAEEFGHPDVVDFVADAFVGHESHSQHEPGQPCSDVCHHCHGHFSHFVSFAKSAALATYVIQDSHGSSLYLGRRIERIRASIFRPPIAA